jgi:hypothetical protein
METQTDKEKVCRIINLPYTWILEVDGHRIKFQGAWTAEYFQHHYASLGYEVELIKEKEL